MRSRSVTGSKSPLGYCNQAQAALNALTSPAQVQMLKLSVGFNELTPRAKCTNKHAAQRQPLHVESHVERLGHLWDSNLEKHQPAIKEMLARAQGEMGLEQFLAEAWSWFAGSILGLRQLCKGSRKMEQLRVSTPDWKLRCEKLR